TVARERIYNEAIKRIKISKHGTIAVEILDIVRCLKQDKLNRDLICTIYNTTFNSEFKNPDLTNVIKLLEENTIVKLKDHNELTIRKLIHERAGKMWSSGEALKKLCSFFEYNKHQEFCTPHVAHVSRSLLNTDCFENKSYFQCLILWRLLFTLRDSSGNSQWVENKEMETAINSYNEILKNCMHYSDGVNSPETFMFYLAKVFFTLQKATTNIKIDWDKITSGILNLPPNFECKFWVLKAVLEFLEKCYQFEKCPEPFFRETINVFIITQCGNLAGDILEEFFNIKFLKTIYGHHSWRNIHKDTSFLKKLFGSPGETLREYLWENVWINELFALSKPDSLIVKIKIKSVQPPSCDWTLTQKCVPTHSDNSTYPIHCMYLHGRF
ncbi:unnamed protein product, partial [Allacma fusca]